jgi:hypothetical protein
MANLINGSSATQHTVTALNRWSVADKQLPRKDTAIILSSVG